MSYIKNIAHIRVSDREYNVYISICYTSMTLHAYKYNDTSIVYDWFYTLDDFKSWLQEPIPKR